MSRPGEAGEALPARPPAVAGSFYPAGATALRSVVDELLARSRAAATPPSLAGPGRGSPLPAGILVPHAGLVYSGVVAAAAWRLVGPAAGSSAGGSAAAGAVPPAAEVEPTTVVLLGTNHSAGWLDGVGVWDGGAWRTPLGDLVPEASLTQAVLELGPPFAADTRCHLGEHSLEVQLPFLSRLAPEARIVALSVGTGAGQRAIAAGARLGRLLAARREAGERVVLAISTDMAHYPAAHVAERVTATLLPLIVALDPEGLADAESASRGEPGVSCGMCGIEPTVLGLAALRAMGARDGVALAAATSADIGTDPRRTVGYLAVAFPAA